ncbi:MAG: glycosyltransferase [Candidatus Glassbacteria bacterium]
MKRSVPDFKALTVVIVSYNSRRFLKRCLNSLMRSPDFPSFRVILVDNASTDGTVQMVRKEYQWVDVIVNRENVGFSAACNMAIEASDSRYILFLNPDIEIEPGAIEKMTERMESSKNTGVLGGLVFDASGSPQHSAGRQIPGIISAFFHLTGLSKLFPRSTWVNQYSLMHTSPYEERIVGAVSGSFMMARRDALTLVSGFDEDFFLYGEDIDICLRVSQKGFDILYFPEARALHHHRASTRKIPLRSTYHFYHSMSLFYRKHRGRGAGRFLSPLVSIACWTMFLLQLLTGEKIRLSGGVVRMERRWMRFVFVFLDLLSIVGSWFLAVYLRYGQLKPLPPYRDYRSYLLFLIIVLVVTYGSMVYLKAYRLKPRDVRTAFKSTLLVFIILNLIFFYSKPIAFSRLVLIYFSVFLFTTFLIWRSVFHLVAISSIGANLYSRRVALAGTVRKTLELLPHLRPEEEGYQIVGVIGRDESDGIWEHKKPYLGNFSEIQDIVKRLSIDEVIIVNGEDDESGWFLTAGYLRGCRVKLRLLTEELSGKLCSGESLKLKDMPTIP